MLILAVDLETNGQEPVTQDVLEIGLVLYDVERRLVVNALSRTFPVQRWDAVAGGIHRIPPEWQERLNALPAAVAEFDPWTAIRGDMADVVIAHGAVMDAPLVKVRWKGFETKPWLCTCDDFDHESYFRARGIRITSRRLSHLAGDYEVTPIGPWHRALVDAWATAELAARWGADGIAARLAWKQAPHFEVRAFQDVFDSVVVKTLKDNGYRFAGEPKQGLAYPGGFEKHYYRKDLLAEEAEAHRQGVLTASGGRWRVVVMPMPPRGY